VSASIVHSVPSVRAAEREAIATRAIAESAHRVVSVRSRSIAAQRRIADRVPAEGSVPKHARSMSGASCRGRVAPIAATGLNLSKEVLASMQTRQPKVANGQAGAVIAEAAGGSPVPIDGRAPRTRLPLLRQEPSAAQAAANELRLRSSALPAAMLRRAARKALPDGNGGDSAGVVAAEVAAMAEAAATLLKASSSRRDLRRRASPR
jgi:hypothetical protein